MKNGFFDASNSSVVFPRMAVSCAVTPIMERYYTTFGFRLFENGAFTTGPVPENACLLTKKLAVSYSKELYSRLEDVDDVEVVVDNDIIIKVLSNNARSTVNLLDTADEVARTLKHDFRAVPMAGFGIVDGIPKPRYLDEIDFSRWGAHDWLAESAEE